MVHLRFLPLALDGFSHVINDIIAGTGGAGFRDTNAWLQALTGNRLPAWFYTGDALGSFNSDIRWLTGILFGLSTAWLLFLTINAAMHQAAQFPLKAGSCAVSAARPRSSDHIEMGISHGGHPLRPGHGLPMEVPRRHHGQAVLRQGAGRMIDRRVLVQVVLQEGRH